MRGRVFLQFFYFFFLTPVCVFLHTIHLIRSTVTNDFFSVLTRLQLITMDEWIIAIKKKKLYWPSAQTSINIVHVVKKNIQKIFPNFCAFVRILFIIRLNIYNWWLDYDAGPCGPSTCSKGLYTLQLLIIYSVNINTRSFLNVSHKNAPTSVFSVSIFRSTK